MRAAATLACVLALLAARVPSARAACSDWKPVATVRTPKDRPVELDLFGRMNSVGFNLTLTAPEGFGRVHYPKPLYSFEWEVRDEWGRPVVLIPKGMVRSHGYGRGSVMFWGGMTFGVGGPLEFVFPGGGLYRVRAHFKFPDLKPGPHTDWTPRCEVWTDWTIVDFRPVHRGKGKNAHLWMSRLLEHGFIVVDHGEVLWLYRTGGPETPRIKLALGRTSEDPKAGGGISYSYKEVDVRVDATGTAHVVFPIAGEKTAYRRIGPGGAVLERTDLAGKKMLAGPSDRIVVVDKIAAPPKPAR